MKLALTAAAAALATLALSAEAQTSGLYASGGYSYYDTERASLGALTLRGGFEFTPNFGAEIEAGFGVQDEDINIGGVRSTAELKSALGVFGVARAPLAPQFNAFGRAGYVSNEIEVSGGGAAVSEDDDALALGIGGEWRFNDFHGVRAGYTWQDYDDAVNVFDIAYVLRF